MKREVLHGQSGLEFGASAGSKARDSIVGKEKGRKDAPTRAPSSFSENLRVLVWTLGCARVWFGFGRRVFLFFVIYNVNCNGLVVSGIRRS